MTCILALIHNNKVYMGGDSITTNGWDKNTLANRKVFHKGDLLIGHSGAVRMQNILMYHVTIRPPEPDETDDHYIVTGLVSTVREAMKEQGVITTQEGRDTSGNDAFMVGYHGKIYWVGSEFDVSRFTEPLTAIGSGADFALGALQAILNLSDKTAFNPERALLRALEISGQFCASVAPPYYVETLEG